MTEENKKTISKIEPESKDKQMAEKKPEQNNNAQANSEKKVEQKKDNNRKVFNKKRQFHKNNRPDSEFEQVVIDIARVTRVMAGGKRMRFRACVAVGNKKGKIGLGLAKGVDVTIAINKAVNQAKKNMIMVKLANKTIPHEIKQKYGAGLILLKPAPEGRGIICGGVVRLMMEVAGIHNVTGKILGTNNKVTNAKTVLKALQNLQLSANKKNKEQKEKAEKDSQKKQEVKTEKNKKSDSKQESK